MSQYTTSAQLQKRVAPDILAQLAGGSTSADLTSPAIAAAITQAIEDASMLADSYLLGHIDLTDSAQTVILEQHVAAGALYYLYQRQQCPNDANPYRGRWNDAEKWFRFVAQGRLHTASAATPEGMVSSTTLTKTKVFSDDALAEL